jgi:hypothetical protein
LTDIGACVDGVATGMKALSSEHYDLLQCPFSQNNEVFLPLMEYANSHEFPMIIYRPFAMGALVVDDDGQGAREAYAHVLSNVKQGLVLTGSSKCLHLVQNAESFVEAWSDVSSVKTH